MYPAPFECFGQPINLSQQKGSLATLRSSWLLRLGLQVSGIICGADIYLVAMPQSSQQVGRAGQSGHGAVIEGVGVAYVAFHVAVAQQVLHGADVLVQ